ncbi:hypothetical protein QQP08_007608 [Theobroma cacao]|nr:hypothetical protein QQP08_007608 [Theobroma cacao]
MTPLVWDCRIWRVTVVGTESKELAYRRSQLLRESCFLHVFVFAFEILDFLRVGINGVHVSSDSTILTLHYGDVKSVNGRFSVDTLRRAI